MKKRKSILPVMMSLMLAVSLTACSSAVSGSSKTETEISETVHADTADADDTEPLPFIEERFRAI